MTTPFGRYLRAVLAGSLVLSGALTETVALTAVPASAGTVLRTINVGNAPSDISSDGTHVWVDNQIDNTVTELDASDGSVVRTIIGPPFANFLIGVVSDGTHVWVADHGGFVYELNTSDGSVVQTLPVLGEPQGIAYDGTDVWVSTDNEEVYKINASTGLVVDQIFVDGSHGIPQRMSADGTHVWAVTNSSDVMEIDASTDAVVRYLTTPAGGGGNSYAVLSDGTHVWVPNNHGGGPGTIAELDASTGSLVQTIALGGQPRAMAYDGTHVWVSDQDGGYVTELNASDGSTIDTFTGVGAGGTDVSQDGTDVWTANYNSNTVSEIAIPLDGTLAITPGVNPPAVRATSPTSGTPVSFTVPTAGDMSGAVPVSCDDAPGSWFFQGQTIVTCTATGGPHDSPRTVQTTLTVTVNKPAPATAPDAPTIGTATAGNGSASVSFGPPAYDGSDPVTSYTVTCAPNGGGASRSASGPRSPLTVSGLSNGATYTCTATATNAIGTSPPSNSSNAFTPSSTESCTQTQSCNATISTPSSARNPAQTVQVTGTPTAPSGTVTVTSAPALLNCPGIPPSIASVTTLTDTGFPTTSSLKATVTQLAVATNPGKVCYSSTTPFKSVSHPKTPKAGTFILLPCTAVANVAPCQVSSQQTPTALVVKFLAAGGDPLFKVVVPTGRLVWPSNFPKGKVGTAYAAHLQSSGGKAPLHWKIRSGQLAPGLTLNPSTGAITGKPTTKGTFTCQVGVTDAESPPQSATISVPITIT